MKYYRNRNGLLAAISAASAGSADSVADEAVRFSVLFADRPDIIAKKC